MYTFESSENLGWITNLCFDPFWSNDKTKRVCEIELFIGFSNAISIWFVCDKILPVEHARKENENLVDVSIPDASCSSFPFKYTKDEGIVVLLDKQREPKNKENKLDADWTYLMVKVRQREKTWTLMKTILKNERANEWKSEQKNRA